MCTVLREQVYYKQWTIKVCRIIVVQSATVKVPKRVWWTWWCGDSIEGGEEKSVYDSGSCICYFKLIVQFVAQVGLSLTPVCVSRVARVSFIAQIDCVSKNWRRKDIFSYYGRVSQKCLAFSKLTNIKNVSIVCVLLAFIEQSLESTVSMDRNVIMIAEWNLHNNDTHTHVRWREDERQNFIGNKNISTWNYASSFLGIPTNGSAQSYS